MKLLRLINEHADNPEFLLVHKMEVQVCLHIWSTNRDECIAIGREFLRVFLGVSMTPEFKPIIDELAREIEGKCLSMHIFENPGER